MLAPVGPRAAAHRPRVLARPVGRAHHADRSRVFFLVSLCFYLGFMLVVRDFPPHPKLHLSVVLGRRLLGTLPSVRERPWALACDQLSGMNRLRHGPSGAVGTANVLAAANVIAAGLHCIECTACEA